jgi:hypothetical protein
LRWHPSKEGIFLKFTMPINIRFERKDKDGNVYYEDRDGNRIPEPTTEEIAEQEAIREELIAESNRRFFEFQRKQSPFLLKSLGNLQKPRARKALWTATAPPLYPLPEGEGKPSTILHTRPIFWAERELCILAGDGGVGKSLVALQVARQLTLPMQNSECKIQNEMSSLLHLSPDPSPKGEGSDSPNERVVVDNINPPSALASADTPFLKGDLKRVLYIDWELTEEEFVARWGSEDVPENFFWMGFHTEGKMPQHIPDKIDWLLQNFVTTVHDTGANILIIDQPDRLHLSPQKWNEFLMKLKAMMRKHELSVMLVLSNKVRHLGRPCGLNNIPKGNILIPVADSVIMMAQNQRRTCERYFKVLKNRNRASAENLEFVDIIELEELDGYLNIHPWGYQRERDMLPPNAAERKNQRIMEAEKLWNSGLSCLEVGEKMYVAESTIKSWLRPLLGEKLTTKSEKYSSRPFPHPGPIKTSLPPSGYSLREGDNPRTTHPAHAEHGHPSREGIKVEN